MSWVENNPVGAALLGACGLLVLIGLGLTLAWSGPVGSGAEGEGAGGERLPTPMTELEALGPLGDYAVVNNRPLFNESRRPVVIDVDVAEEEPEPVVEMEVADPPKVRLTGVVITPTERVVTLTPEAGGKSVVLREGMPLEGKFVGWSVDKVQPRRVSLRSAEGESFDVELAVHDAMIAEPPEPEPAPGMGGQDEALAGEDGEAVPAEARSRADEIRERIRQRREQLRAEAEEDAAREEAAQASKKNAYQEAIQSMINRSSKSDDSEEAGDG